MGISPVVVVSSLGDSSPVSGDWVSPSSPEVKLPSVGTAIEVAVVPRPPEPVNGSNAAPLGSCWPHPAVTVTPSTSIR